MVEKAIRLQGANDGLLSLMKDDPSIKITQVINNSRDRHRHHHPPHHYRHRYSHCHHIIFFTRRMEKKNESRCSLCVCIQVRRSFTAVEYRFV